MKTELWLRLKRYHFDHVVPAHLADRVRASFGGADAFTQAFASKVARKLGWTRAFTLQAIHEYKKFVYLGVVSDASVTPPKVIDQVWHEHLLFTRAYRDFCRDVLGRDFDHHPELVRSRDQSALFEAQYAETLASYRSEFDREAPPEIWGTPKFKSTGVVKTPVRKSPADRSASSDASSYESDPLHLLFAADGGAPGSSDASHFGGGGGFSGGGSSGAWDGPLDGGHDSGHGGEPGSGSESGGAGSGDSGGDGGGSGCSSSCGGGGD